MRLADGALYADRRGPDSLRTHARCERDRSSAQRAPWRQSHQREPRKKRGEPWLCWYDLCGLAGGVGSARIVHRGGVHAPMTDADRRAAIERHWVASQARDEAAEQAIY